MSTYYLTAGLIPNDGGYAAAGVTTYYITAGLIPGDNPYVPPVPPTPPSSGGSGSAHISLAAEMTISLA